MKIFSTLLLSGLLLISCSDDDDKDGGFQEGWNQELVNELIKNCEGPDFDDELEEEGVNINLDCDCVANETAKFAPLSKVLNGLSETEEIELGLVLVRNCAN